MAFQDYVDALKGELEEILDLDELEVKIYLNLLRTGPITASALAKELDVDRARMYRTVDKLVSRNILSTTLSIPKLCIPADPKEALNLALKKKEDEVKKIKKSGQGIIEKITNDIEVSNGTTVPTFRVVQGRSNIYSDIAQLIENSSGITYLVTTLEDISKMYHSVIPEKIKISEKKGGIVRLLVEINNAELTEFVKRFKATEIRVCKLPSNGRMVVQKDNQLIMSDSTNANNLSQNSELDFSLCTNSIEMINNLNKFCEMLWESGEPLNSKDMKGFSKKKK
ncbi:MAG: TrmB family transcriptional regulator [Nitrosopumilaceae archaeon]|uniref:TrmB family transcriptional regulator n=1 Tax=Candidatus Nitrosomaritimum aestuariumsis TaxID=3342354 RepID=A0AC60W8S6_9ARCH|nr:TrmB family transcriptional regulator [Nitrosopumilaceae archaeon]